MWFCLMVLDSMSRQLAQPAADVRMQVRAANWTGDPAEGDAETEVGLIRANQSALLPFRLVLRSPWE